MIRTSEEKYNCFSNDDIHITYVIIRFDFQLDDWDVDIGMFKDSTITCHVVCWTEKGEKKLYLRLPDSNIIYQFFMASG